MPSKKKNARKLRQGREQSIALAHHGAAIQLGIEHAQRIQPNKKAMASRRRCREKTPQPHEPQP